MGGGAQNIWLELAETFRASLPAALTLLMLGASAAWLARLDYLEWRRYQSDHQERTLAALAGSLEGYTASGFQYSPDVLGESRLIVAFTLHDRSIQRDLALWGQVAREIKATGLAANVKLLAYCDSGAACYGPSRRSTFEVFGFADPLQMHAVAFSDESGQAMVFGRDGNVVGKINEDSGPRTIIASIFNDLKRSNKPGVRP